MNKNRFSTVKIIVSCDPKVQDCCGVGSSSCLNESNWCWKTESYNDTDRETVTNGSIPSDLWSTTDPSDQVPASLLGDVQISGRAPLSSQSVILYFVVIIGWLTSCPQRTTSPDPVTSSWHVVTLTTTRRKRTATRMTSTTAVRENN